MRAYRVGLFVAWAIVASLAVAGFAAFATPDDTDIRSAEAVTIAAVAPDLGRSAGVVAGLSFVYFVDGEEITTTTVDTDAAVARAIERRLSDNTTTTVIDTDDDGPARGSVFIRSEYLRETDVRALIATHFAAEDVSRAVRIAWCESSFNPSAVNPVTRAAGLFQHDPETWGEYADAAGWAGASALDPEANVAVAAWMLYELPGGWSHWQCQA